MERYICERIEEGTVILEKDKGEYLNISVQAIGFEVSEGDVILFDGEKYSLCEGEKEERQNKLLALQKKIKEKQKKG